MLRSELPFAIDTGPGRVAAVALGEPFLGFLAIVALGLTLFPMLFAVTPAVDSAIEAGQWAIIAWFSVELVVAFVSAHDKRQFIANPWRWLDLATILLALGSLLPSAGAALRSAPILRLARKVMTRPWTMAGTFIRAEKDWQVLEFACHEGNRAIDNIRESIELRQRHLLIA